MDIGAARRLLVLAHLESSLLQQARTGWGNEAQDATQLVLQTLLVVSGHAGDPVCQIGVDPAPISAEALNCLLTYLSKS